MVECVYRIDLPCTGYIVAVELIAENFTGPQAKIAELSILTAESPIVHPSLVTDKFLAFEAELQELFVVILAPSANLLAEPLVDELAHVVGNLSAEEPILEPISAENLEE
jgi:hypothetical protein